MQKWILDFEGYQVGTNYYPTEIALLNASNTNKCFHWCIGHTEVFTRMDVTTRYQFRRHGMRWDDGNLRFGKALEELRNVFTHDNDQQHTIYIKGMEKTNWARHWFIENPNVEVKEICNTPNFSDLMIYYGNCTCVFFS